MSTKIDSYQRTVEDLQSAIASDATMPENTLAELADQYAAACHGANERLRECRALLREGLRGEAIERAEVAPNLVDLVAVLDFNGREQWCAWLRDTGRPLPPAILMDAAADLNAAYALEQPLATEMRQHRRLALARAPLRERIAVLRRIAQTDVGNPIWVDDLRRYEAGRHKQLQAEIDGAVRAGDGRTLGELEQELREPFWLESPPPVLLQRAAQFATRLQADQARREMQGLERELTASFADFDVDRGRKLRGRWKACALLAGLADNDPLAESVAPALEWLEEQDRRDQAGADYEKAVAELERGLDQGCSRHDLDRLYHSLARCERGVTDVLQRRYQERAAALALAATRRTRLMVAGIVAATLVVAGITWFTIAHQLQEREVASAAAALHQLLEEDKPVEAGKYLATLDADKPWMTARPEIEELRVRLEGMNRVEKERQAAFRAALEKAEAAGVEAPDRKTLEEADNLARTPDEKAAVREIVSKIAKHDRELQDERNAMFTKQVDDFRLRVEELEADRETDPRQKLLAIKKLRDDADELVRAGAGVESALVDNVGPLQKRLASLSESENLEIESSQLLQAVTDGVGNEARYRQALADYIKRRPGSKRSGDFQRILDGGALADEQLRNWTALSAAFSQLDVGHIKPAEAAARIAEATALLAEFDGVAQADMVRGRVTVLQPIARRVEGGQPIESDLKARLQLPTIAGLKMATTTSGENYYLDSDPKETPPLISFKYLEDFTPNKKDARLRPDKLADKISEAPQSALSRFALDELAKLGDEPWEIIFCRIIIKTHDNRLLDPILKVQLLADVIGVARKGSHVLETAFAKQYDLLINDGPDGTINWLNPFDAKAKRARISAEAVLKRLPSLTDGRDAAARELAQLRKRWAPRQYRWVGWLDLDGDHWHCASNGLPETLTGELVVVSRGGQPARTTTTVVGRIDGGRAEVTGGVEAMLEGQPLYAAFEDSQGRKNKPH